MVAKEEQAPSSSGDDNNPNNLSSSTKAGSESESESSACSSISDVTSHVDSEAGQVKKDDDDDTESNESRCCASKRVFWGLCIFFFLVVVGVPVGVLIAYFQDKDTVRGLAQCGDCHCIYEDVENGTCPEMPPTEFSQEFLDSLLALRPIYSLPTLDCDPYQAGDCQPSIKTFVDDSQAVCAIHFMQSEGSATCDSYWMVSYPNATAAQAAGGYVTHRGTCGLCSSLQDLVVYMKYSDLTTLRQECGVKGVTVRENGVECFQKKLGMTEGCAAIWMANVRSTLYNCGGICFVEDLTNHDFNGPAPTCALSPCLLCDEDNSGEVFKKFAGRTRRRSGLISAIARPCDSIAAEIRHELPQTCHSWFR